MVLPIVIDQGCSICLDPISADEIDTRIQTACQHIFHRICLEPWLVRNSSCPLCRENIGRFYYMQDIDLMNRRLEYLLNLDEDGDEVELVVGLLSDIGRIDNDEDQNRFFLRSIETILRLEPSYVELFFVELEKIIDHRPELMTYLFRRFSETIRVNALGTAYLILETGDERFKLRHKNNFLEQAHAMMRALPENEQQEVRDFFNLEVRDRLRNIELRAFHSRIKYRNARAIFEALLASEPRRQRLYPRIRRE